MTIKLTVFLLYLIAAVLLLHYCLFAATEYPLLKMSMLKLKAFNRFSNSIGLSGSD